MTTAFLRNGHKGTVSAPDANGFRAFTGDNGVRFTVAEHEWSIAFAPPPAPIFASGIIVRRVVRAEHFGRVQEIIEDAPIVPGARAMKKAKVHAAMVGA